MMKFSASLPILGRMRRNARPMSREKADTLLLLFACALVLLPEFAQAPPWVTSICSLLLLWRGWITLRGNRMPSRWMLLPVCLLAMGGVFASYKTLLGREAGVTMLTLLLTLKLLEMHARRDLFVVIFLGFFLILTNLFKSQSIGSALLMLFALVMMLTAQLSFQYTVKVPPLMQRIKAALVILGLAAPLMLVMFVLFPRIQGPLWGLPGDANAGRSGLSESMSPGNFSNLALSDDVAFRVRFYDAPPMPAERYWRAIVLGKYDGRTWTPRPTVNAQRKAKFTANGNPIRYQVTIEPHGKRWLFALEMPDTAPLMPGKPATLDADFQSWAPDAVTDRVRYESKAYALASIESNASAASLREWLGLPQGYNPATILFADRIRRRTVDDLDRVNAVLAYFRSEPFRYTLQPPLLGRDAVDEFLFSTRAGFCEHYSSAFVVLMRAMGIPARVVTGYQGGEINPVDGFMTVRQSDAHAWAEIWIAERGWMRIDPTAAVAPNRIERGLAASVPRSALGGLLTLNVGKNSWLNALRFRWDAVSNAWNQWVLNYTPDKQKSLIKSLGFDDVDWRTLSVLLVLIGSVVLAFIALPLLANRQKIDPARAIYMRFCQLMERRGLPRALHEGPHDYRMRIAGAGSALATGKKSAAARFLAFYEAVQYGRVSASLQAAQIARLKSLLSECR